MASVPLPQPLVPVRFLRRLNRFAAAVELDGRVLTVHVPNSGRMTELLVPGAPARILLQEGPGRRTRGRLLLVRHQGRWVSVDATMPNRLLAACLAEGSLPLLAGYTRWQQEARWGSGRIDFLLRREGDGRPEVCLVEAKSCNLVEEGVALFPDAPTARGARHVRELGQAVAQGYGAAVLFFIQRDDARAFRPHERADPEFARALREAAALGLAVRAYRCRVTLQAITVLDEVPVLL